MFLFKAQLQHACFTIVKPNAMIFKPDLI